MSRSRHIAACTTLLVATGSCGTSSRPAGPSSPPRIAIIASERGAEGARLVALDEAGDRQFELLETPGELARDSHPAVSPDGRWVVFASSRGRPIEQTSLWLARLAPQATPVRITDSRGIDSHPVWTPDGMAVVFASTREGDDFDLYRVAITEGTAAAPERLTDGPGHEVTPAVGNDGTVFYGAIVPVADGQVESRIEARGPDGTIRQVTAGPADTSPAVSPDGRTLAFARPVAHAAGPDGELWTMPVAGAAAAAAPLLELPLTDESGPVWSPDGRYVFATSVLRGAAGNVVFSSVIVVDTRARPIKARLLRDRVGAIARLTPAITRVPLDHAALARDPEYLPELARIMAPAMAHPTAAPGTP